MKITLTRTRKTADGAIVASAELPLDPYLDYDPEQLRDRLARIRGTLEAAVADTPPPAPDPEPEKHAPAIATPAPDPEPAAPTVGPADQGPPRTGKALFAWARRRDDRLRGRETMSYLRDLGHAWGLGQRIIEWPDSEAQAAYHECLAKLETAPIARGA